MPKVTRSLRRYCSLITAFSAVFFTATPVSAQDYQLSGPNAPVRAGYFVVEASQSQSAATADLQLRDLQLQQSVSESFDDAKYYHFFGDFSELTVTGVPSGNYFLRLVDSAGSPRSNIIEVRVDHYPLWQALTLFFIGLILFVILLITQLYFFIRNPIQITNEVKHE
ncbi:MAG TPA: hypothetical protein VFM61_06080 [Pseudidiomarina sp.]|nr:hypothetical protein [Pseudidiomarina sp.]